MDKLAEQLTSKKFKNNHWQKRHKVFKHCLYQSFEDLTLESLLRMWNDSYFYSKIISFDNAWHVLEAETKFDFANDPGQWTLLTHNLEKYFLSVKEFLNNFKEFPKWAFDDVMSSYSKKGSLSPAHIDNYSVFIVQVSGSRKWELQYDPTPGYFDDQPVRILKSFKPDHEIFLNPGDIIYIPPGVAHQGTAIEDSLSLSIGIQSLNLKDLLFQHVNQLETKDSYFLPAVKHGRRIDEGTFKQIKQQMIDELLSDESLQDSLLGYLSRSEDEQDEGLIDISEKEFTDHWKAVPLLRDELIDIFASKTEKDLVKIAIKESIFLVTNEQYKKLESLFDQDLDYEIDFSQYSDLIQFIFPLFSKGVFFFPEE